MANIGTFKKLDDSFTGEIFTIALQTKNVRILPEEPSENDNAPTHRIFVGRAEIGAVWTKVSKEGLEYHSVKLDDPSFNAPIFATMFLNPDGKSYDLVWTRSRPTNGN